MFSSQKSFLASSLAFVLFLVIAVLPLCIPLVYAQQGQNTTGGGGQNTTGGGGQNTSATLQNPLGNVSLQEFLFKIIDILLVFAIPLIVFFIILAGFTYVTAGGNESKVHKATHMLTWSVIGGVIIVGARAIMIIIENTVNSLK